jgi:hypothetical protein
MVEVLLTLKASGVVALPIHDAVLLRRASSPDEGRTVKCPHCDACLDSVLKPLWRDEPANTPHCGWQLKPDRR